MKTILNITNKLKEAYNFFTEKSVLLMMYNESI